MSSSRQTDNANWLLVEWKTGGRDVVYVRSVVSPTNKELKAGDILTVNRRGEQESATLIARARERDELDSLIKKEEAAGPSVKHEEEPEDFSSSASSWVPSDDGAQSGDSVGEVQNKKIKLERCKRQYSNRRSSKKVITPSHRANPVIPKVMQQANTANRKRPHNGRVNNISINKSVPDSTKKNNRQSGVGLQNVTIDVRELMNIKNSFKILFKMIEDLKQPASTGFKRSVNEHVPVALKSEDMTVRSYAQSLEEDKEIENSENEEFNRSDDNVLITNKYNNIAVKSAKKGAADDNEWVPIGSGKTLIHVDQFKRVNWKSYTIATRTLLLAVFPRRILATHSLTGKKSPAFLDKPAKMCLDPKIISDVIMEIMDRFNVKENLVRSIITTKCADECKMWKTRVKKEKKTPKNQENVPPPNKNLEDQEII